MRRKRHHRSWAQRSMLALNVMACMACFVAAAGLAYARSKDQIRRVHARALVDVGEQLESDIPTEGTLPPGSAHAQNWLLTGSDSRDCIDPNSPEAGGFLTGGTGGNLSDTIMVLRIDPANDLVAALSLPRDLWVDIPRFGRSNRINSAYDREDPDKLIETISTNFGIPLHHWADVDVCAFRDLVDAVGGVRLGFNYPTRDTETGLNVNPAECYLLNGTTALHYVRSRHYEYADGTVDRHNRPVWTQDPSGDIGRAKRQQEFLRAIANKALANGFTQPRRFSAMLDALGKNVFLDFYTSNGDLKQLGLTLVGLEPDRMQTYVVHSYGRKIDDKAVQLVSTGGEGGLYNKAVLSIMRGESLPEGFGPPVEGAIDTTIGSTSVTVATDEGGAPPVVAVNEPTSFAVVPTAC